MSDIASKCAQKISAAQAEESSRTALPLSEKALAAIIQCALDAQSAALHSRYRQLAADLETPVRKRTYSDTDEDYARAIGFTEGKQFVSGAIKAISDGDKQ